MWLFSKKEEKPVNPVIQALKEALEEQQVAVKATKLLLKEAKRGPQEESTPFIETMPMRAYLRTVRFVTTPFANLHERAHLAYEYPEEYRRDQFLREADDLLEECKEAKEPSNSKAKSLSAQTFHMIAELKAEAERETWKRSTAVIKDLEKEFKRLAKPTKAGKKLADTIEQTMERTMQNVRDKVSNPEPEGA